MSLVDRAGKRRDSKILRDYKRDRSPKWDARAFLCANPAFLHIVCCFLIITPALSTVDNDIVGVEVAVQDRDTEEQLGSVTVPLGLFSGIGEATTSSWLTLTVSPVLKKSSGLLFLSGNSLPLSISIGEKSQTQKKASATLPQVSAIETNTMPELLFSGYFVTSAVRLISVVVSHKIFPLLKLCCLPL